MGERNVIKAALLGAGTVGSGVYALAEMLKDEMFQKTDFWIGLAVGAVAGIFGYRFMQEREQQMAALQPAAPAGEVPLAELQRQKEELEDLIAVQEAKKN